MSLKRTKLYDMHVEYGGKMVDFGGWELPVQYAGIIKEHNMVRQKAGLFDVSHMGEIEIKGDQAEDFIQYLMTNDVKNIKDNQVQYTLMCYPHGGVVDDLIIYRFSREHYLLVVNAANTDKDFDWIQINSRDGFPSITIENVSEQYSQLALQGPAAEDILQKICSIDLKDIKYFWFNPRVKLAGIDCLVSRTGYTGEDGFEIYTSGDASVIWEEILKAGGEDVAPIGLGARDTLRFEAKLPLYGQEINEDISPLEAGLGYFVKLDKENFIGQAVLKAQQQTGGGRVTVQFEMVGKGIPRSHYQVEKNGVNIGWVTTGAFAPALNKTLGLALIKPEFNVNEGAVDIIIRDKKIPARIRPGIFYKRSK